MRLDWLAKELKAPAAPAYLALTLWVQATELGIFTQASCKHFLDCVYYLLSPLTSLLMKNKSAQIGKVQSNMSLDFKPQKADDISTSECPKYFDHEQDLLRILTHKWRML